MVRYFIVSVNTLERWKRKLAKSQSFAVLIEIQQLELSGGEPTEKLWTGLRWTWSLQIQRR